jgi:hypothetical protein
LFVVNGQEVEWAKLFVRLDHFITRQDRALIDTLIYRQQILEAHRDLPARIASAISEQRAPVAPAGSASNLSGWIHLTKSVVKVLQWFTASLGLLLLAMGRVGWPDLWRTLIGSLN